MCSNTDGLVQWRVFARDICCWVCVIVIMVQDVQYKADELVFQQGNARSAFLVVKQGEVGKLSAH